MQLTRANNPNHCPGPPQVKSVGGDGGKNPFLLRRSLGHESTTMASPPTPWYKTRLVIGLGATLLVAGAIVAAGVLGARAAELAQSDAPEQEAINVKVSQQACACTEFAGGRKGLVRSVEPCLNPPPTPPPPAPPISAIQSDVQPAEIKSVLDSLINAKTTTTNAPVVTPVAPQEAPASPSSALGTFNNDLALSDSSSSGSSSSSSSSSLLNAFIPKVSDENAAAIDKPIVPLQDQANGAIVQQQQVASKTMSALLAASGAAICSPKTSEELHHAIDDSACTIVALNRQVISAACRGALLLRAATHLTDFPSPPPPLTRHSDEYHLNEPIVVSRTIIVIGNPVLLPRLDPGKSERLFHGRYAYSPRF